MSCLAFQDLQTLNAVELLVKAHILLDANFIKQQGAATICSTRFLHSVQVHQTYDH
jgi:hypothetical protein